MTEPETPQPTVLGDTGPLLAATSADKFEHTLARGLRRRNIPNDPLARSEFLMLAVARQLNSIRLLLWTTLVIIPALGLVATIVLIIVVSGATPTPSSVYQP